MCPGKCAYKMPGGMAEDLNSNHLLFLNNADLSMSILNQVRLTISRVDP
jgi:hypothetical protein